MDQGKEASSAAPERFGAGVPFFWPAACWWALWAVEPEHSPIEVRFLEGLRDPLPAPLFRPAIEALVGRVVFAKALGLARRPETHYTPEHGSWLNVAKIGQGALGTQAHSRRIPTGEAMEQRTVAWQEKHNAAEDTVEWQFTSEEARVKLKQLCPNIEG